MLIPYTFTMFVWTYEWAGPGNTLTAVINAGYSNKKTSLLHSNRLIIISKFNESFVFCPNLQSELVNVKPIRAHKN